MSRTLQAERCIANILRVLYPGGNVDLRWGTETMTQIAEVLMQHGFGPFTRCRQCGTPFRRLLCAKCAE